MTTGPLPAFKLAKRASEVIPITLNLQDALRTFWVAGRRYAIGEYVRPTEATGFAYQASGAGEAAFNEPRWPTTPGNTVVDGSVTWTCVAAASNAVDPIQSAAWANVSSGIVVTSTATGVEETSANVTGGTAGTIYQIRCTVTTVAGEVYIAEWDVTVQ